MDNLYYRPAVRNSRRSLKSKSRFFKFLIPVGGILAVLFVFWLLMQIWGFFSNLKGTDFSTSATVYVAEGASVQKQNYGTTQFLPVLSGEVVLEGDSIRTMQNTKAVVEFFNGLVVRLDESTSLTLSTLDNGKKEDTVELKVNAGTIWLNKPETVKTSSNLVVSTNYLKARTVGTIFSVKAGLPENVAVIDGTVLVEVIDSTDASVLDQVNVLTNQQIVLDNQAYESFKKRETPRVLSGLLDSFKDSDWYKWNLREDQNPTNFSTDSALTSNSDYLDQTSPLDSGDDLDSDSELDELDELDDTPKPEITFPKNGEVIESDTVELVGTVPTGTQAVVVSSFESGEANPYVLKGFKPGDATFKYIAKYIPDGSGNMIVGTNKFEVRSVDENGVESNAEKVTFELEIPGVESSTTQNDDDDSANNAADVEVSNLEFDNNLAAPVLKTLNDKPASNGLSLAVDRGVLVGKIGTWAKSVVINGYKLQQYVPNSGEFTYILSKGFNTLKPGENKVVVYGFDEKGNRGIPATFIINYVGN